MSTVLDRDTREETETGEPEAAHIVKTEPGENAAAKVLEARVYGTMIEALCGQRFIPKKDATKLPLCQECKEIYEIYRMMGDGSLNEVPSD